MTKVKLIEDNNNLDFKDIDNINIKYNNAILNDKLN
jgi:hypothetical protein